MNNHLTKDERERQGAVFWHLIVRRVFPLWILGYVLILIFTWCSAPFWLVDGLAWLQTHIPSLRMAARVGEKYGESAIPNQIMLLYGMLMQFGFTGYFLAVGLREVDKENSSWPMFKNWRMEAYKRPWRSIGMAFWGVALLLIWYFLYVIEPEKISKRSVGLWDSNLISYFFFHCVYVFLLSLCPVFFIIVMRYSLQRILLRT
jgi:hypothetical protein